MAGSIRRLDRHGRAVLLSEALDGAGQKFQLALQLVYLEMRQDVEKALKDGSFTTDNGERLARRALANYAAAAMIMPYAPFARAVEARRYDVEAISRQFGTSFEQTAHRLTTLQKHGQERGRLFFTKVDPAGQVSQRPDGGGYAVDSTAGKHG